jgi:hypothetical protein
MHSACTAAIHHRPRLLGYNCCVAEFVGHTEQSIGVALTDLVSTHQHHVDFEGGVRTRIVLDTSVLVAHLHVHVVPRRRKDGLRGFFWPRVRYDSDAEADDYAERLRTALI